jgi:hypothetical protein
LQLWGHSLVRHSIVWLGQAFGETARGLPASHPLCLVLLRLLEQVNFVGTWLTCREVSSMREFERKALLLRLHKAGWTIDAEQTSTITAHRAVRLDAPWPFGAEPALPSPQFEILVLGCHAGFVQVSCQNEREWRSQHALRGDGLVLSSGLANLISVERSYAISVGRTQTDNSPGLSILGPEGWLDPELFVGDHAVVDVHTGTDAAWAWSYRRIDSNG